MLRKTLVLTLTALLCMAAAPKPAGRPARPAAPSHAAALDARDPASLITLLSSLSAKAEVARRDGDAVFLTVTSPTEVFSVQFAGCNPQGRGCQALLFDRQGAQGSGAQGSPTLVQLNAFNQTSVMCRLYQDKGGRAHVVYSSLLFAKDGRAEMLMHLNAWRGCIGDFSAFVKDPTAFLAGAE